MELYRELKSLYIIVGIGYAALGSIAGIKKWNDTPYSQPIFWSSLFCIWLLHGYTLHKTILQNDIIQLNVATSVSLLVALAIAIYTIGQYGHWAYASKQMYRFWHLTLIPSALFAVLPSIWSHSHPLITEGSFWARIHWWIGLLSIATLCVATIQAEWLMHWSKRLKKMPHDFDAAPSLLVLERGLFGWITISFLLQSSTIITGTFFSEQLWHHAFKWSHKILFALITWLFLCILLWRRHREGIRGHAVALWLRWSCAFAILGYIGSKFVLEVLLHR